MNPARAPEIQNVRDLLPRSLAGQVRTARELVETRRRAGEERYVATAFPPLDRLLAGGIERGSTVELVGWRSSGRFSLVLTALAAATSSGEAAALVDLGDSLDPQAAADAGVELERLLWARPRRLKEALGSAEVILSSGMPLVVIDLGMPPVPGGRGSEAAWLRLARAARAQRTALLVSSPYRVSGTAAQVVLEACRPRGCWDGHAGAPRLLRGIDSRLELRKSRSICSFSQSDGRCPSAETLALRSAGDLRAEPPAAVSPARDRTTSKESQTARRAIA